MRRWPISATIAALLLVPAGCAPPAELPAERVDLGAADPAPRFESETLAIDIGTPAARPALWGGWGPDERSGESSFAWSGGESSTVVFTLFNPRDVALKLRGWSFPFADGRGVAVAVRLNGREAGRIEVAREPRTYAIPLAAGLLRAGENRLDLKPERWNDRPGESPWAVAWDGISLGGAANDAERPKFETGAVVLAAGSALSWTLPLPAGAVVVWDAVDGDVEPAIEARRDAGSPIAESLMRGAGRLDLPPSAESGGEATITLRAFAAEKPSTSGAIRIAGLRVHRPEEPPSEEAATAPPAAAQRPNLVVYLIDTLRADRLGCYGYARPTSPRIDAFAREALLFREGRAQSSWTRPAVATILTGLPPWSHGVERRSSRLPETIETLGERLQSAGYETALFTTNANIVARFGFAQGWDEFHALFERSGGARRHVDSAAIHREVVAWLDRRAGRQGDGASRPFFLFVHTLDPHDPYRPAEEFRRKLADGVEVEFGCCGSAEKRRGQGGEPARARAQAASALYDAEIAQNDAAFGMLLDELERRELAASTAILLTSDHGEEFFEHGGFKHGATLYEEMLAVPFVLRPPGVQRPGVERTDFAEQIDVAPTLLALAGVAAAPELPGRNLLAAGAERPGRALRSTARLALGDGALESLRIGSSKLVARRGGWTPPLGLPPFLLFDLATDPAEVADLALERWAERRVRAAELESALAGAAKSASEEADIDPELDRELKALGYL